MPSLNGFTKADCVLGTKEKFLKSLVKHQEKQPVKNKAFAYLVLKREFWEVFNFHSALLWTNGKT